ncbi:DUF262 domain-containing protein [Nocardia sp. NPDC004123]
MVAAQETSLQRILEGSSQYLVPLYQRPYGWGDEQLRELWNDVIQLAEDRTEEPESTHFIGSVVLAPTPAGVAGAVTRFLVVDGQQRLTTLTLLLAAIRDYLRAVDGSASRDTDRIHNQLLTNQYHDDPDRLKLLPTQVDRPAYTAVIDGSATDDDGNIGSAYRFFRSRLDELTAADDMPFGLSQVVQAVVSGLSVVSISAHPGDNVHRIFQSLNNTGLKLTQGDLLRNYLFMRLPHRSEEVYRTHWLPLQASLDNERIETLFWLDMLHKRPSVKQSQTFAAQQARLEKLTSEEQIVAEIERIARLGRLYRLMSEPEAEPDPRGSRAAYPPRRVGFHRACTVGSAPAAATRPRRSLERAGCASSAVHRIVAGAAIPCRSRISGFESPVRGSHAATRHRAAGGHRAACPLLGWSQALCDR